MSERSNKRLVLWRDARILFGLSGLILSVALHELFHIIVHWGDVTGVALFTNPYTIAEVTVFTHPGYDTAYEEAIAYGITGIVMLATITIVWRIHDAKDTRTVAQILATGA